MANQIVLLHDGRFEVKRIPDLCEYDGCNERATHVAYSRKYDKAGGYCEKHADTIAEDTHPEYVKFCPNCGCEFGVN